MAATGVSVSIDAIGRSVRGMTTPTANAPKTAYRPISSVYQATRKSSDHRAEQPGLIVEPLAAHQRAGHPPAEEPQQQPKRIAPPPVTSGRSRLARGEGEHHGQHDPGHQVVDRATGQGERAVPGAGLSRAR